MKPLPASITYATMVQRSRTPPETQLTQARQMSNAAWVAKTAIGAAVEAGKAVDLLLIGSLASEEQFGKALRETGGPNLRVQDPLIPTILQDHRRAFHVVPVDGLIPGGHPRFYVPLDESRNRRRSGTRVVHGDRASLTTMPAQGESTICMRVRITPEIAAALAPRERDCLLKCIRPDLITDVNGHNAYNTTERNDVVVVTFVAQPETLATYHRHARAMHNAPGSQTQPMNVRIGYIENSLAGLRSLPDIGPRAVLDVTRATTRYIREACSDVAVIKRLNEAEKACAAAKNSPEAVDTLFSTVVNLLEESRLGSPDEMIKWDPQDKQAQTRYLEIAQSLDNIVPATAGLSPRLTTDQAYATALLDRNIRFHDEVHRPVEAYAHFIVPQLKRMGVDVSELTPTAERSVAVTRD